MANIKISQLPSISISDITDNDVVPIVDVETSSTKKIRVSELLDYINCNSGGSGGTNIVVSGANGIRISQLPILNPSDVTDDDVIAIVDTETATTRKVRLTDLINYISSNIGPGSGTGSVGVTVLNDLLDVDTVTVPPTNGQALVYNSASNLWEPGTILGANGTVIGQAEDGSYEDGLFTDFIPETPIGTAVDRINEFLKSLAPKSPPDLEFLKSNQTSLAMKVSFDENTPPPPSYTEAPGLVPGNVFVSNQTRFGAWASTPSVTLTLNQGVSGDIGAFENYPANSFKVSPENIDTFTLFVNEQPVSAISTTSTSSVSDLNFNLTEAKFTRFTITGQVFDYFKYRTGTVTIPVDSWRLGYNTAKVVHSSSLGQFNTNNVEWFYDITASAGIEPYLVTSNLINVAPGGTKHLSGIEYYKTLQYNFSASIQNYYKNIYSANANGGITFNNVSPSSLSVTPFSGPPAPATLEQALIVNSAHSVGNGTRMLGTAASSTINIANGLGKVAQSTKLSPTILLDSLDTANTTYEEKFCFEDWRIPSGSYINIAQADSIQFPSTQDLAEKELAVFNGSIIYPSNINVPGVITNGNIAAATVDFLPPGQPDYSTATGERAYFRRIRNIEDDVIRRFILEYGGTKIKLIPSSQPFSSSDDEVKILVKIPPIDESQTILQDPLQCDWRDITIPIGPSDLGTLEGDLPTSTTSATVKVNFRFNGVRKDGVGLVLIKIIVGSNWKGFINKLLIKDINYN